MVEVNLELIIIFHENIGKKFVYAYNAYFHVLIMVPVSVLQSSKNKKVDLGNIHIFS